ncbi:MAG: hypothetical protein A2Y23_11765 [Clostridiales bacterium GWB2_37_7]|nr:MAG: hypothetical protein A2Y23_11765 [Clostridiales bacterium GWB2_37_7]
MFLSFIGSGSALNTTLGNNNAFIKKGETLLLLDCGSTTFSRMQRLNLLHDTKNIFVFITHRHPDHISSLGDLIFYAHYILKVHVNVLSPDGENVAKLLEYMGVKQEYYTLITLTSEYILNNVDIAVTVLYVPVEHIEDMNCYGYIIKYEGLNIFYSGDSKDIPNSVFQRFEKQEIDYIYQDICSYDYPDNPHMYINKLYELVQSKDRARVFCMHYDESFDGNQILQMGFKLVENIEE